jgi:hypothetical protein
MKSGAVVQWARSREARLVHGLEIAALCLSAIALIITVVFVWHTTGGTLFVFTIAAPVMVLAATLIVACTTVREFNQAHRLFAVERRDAGEVIFRQGDPGDGAYFIRRGRVEVIDSTRDRVVATLGPGDYFGEMALLGDQARNATVKTLSDCELAVLGKQNFLQMVSLLPTTREAVIATVRERAMRNSGSRPAADDVTSP